MPRSSATPRTISGTPRCVKTGAVVESGRRTGVAYWSSPRFLDEITAWTDDSLGTLPGGARRTEAVSQTRVRSWSTILRVQTTVGQVWVKASSPATAFEVALYETLPTLVPDHVLTPIATDRTRGWTLLPDGGPCLAMRPALDAQLTEALRLVAPAYARLQRAVAPAVDTLPALGVADMRPAAMPTRFDEALSLIGETLVDEAQRDVLERVRAHRPTFVSWCERLAACPGGASLDHNDLHHGNILLAPGDDLAAAGKDVRFYDWGDAVVAHPFASLLVLLGSLAQRLETNERDPRLAGVRDAYLAAFADLDDAQTLVETAELACRVGKVARALTWHRAVATAPDADEDTPPDPRFVSAPLDCLASVLDEGFLTTW
jgi:hypothetical protein